jgi:predicted ATP-grasp superfamily ATP-dependent carboligase
MNKTAIILTSNPALALKAVYDLKSLGYVCLVVTSDMMRDLQASRYVDDLLLFPENADLSAKATFLNHLNADIIVGVEVAACMLLHDLHHIEPSLPVFPCSPPGLLDALDNKASFIELADRFDVRTPRSATIENANQLARRLGDFHYPLMVKTLYGESGKGVVLLPTPEAVSEYAAHYFAKINKPLQLQQYIAGPTVGLNLIARDGEIHAWSSYTKIDSDTLSFDNLPLVRDAVAPLIKGTGYSGLANFDLIRTEVGDHYVIECNPRVWYNMQADRHLGLNYMEHGIRARTQTAPVAPPTCHTGEYVFPMRVLKNTLGFKSRGIGASAASWRGVWEVISDPLCQLRKLNAGR